jgi:hypothetical protein
LTGFSADWLSLREPIDLRARNTVVRDAVASYMKDRAQLTIIDLGSGTGSTLRALAPHLESGQRWRLVDNDANLLARATALLGPAGASFETTPFDFSRTIEPLLEAPTDLLTASALFDLVSEQWLIDVTHSIATRRLPVYIALSYDGRVTLDPADPLDASVVGSFNDHQLTDKGFGPSLGPGAASRTIALLKAAGFVVVTGQSDWVATAQDGEFLVLLLQGWADAARDMKRLSGADIDAWLGRRVSAIEAGQLTVTVGHIDFFAYPHA